jgi:hypothetical protein
VQLDLPKETAQTVTVAAGAPAVDTETGNLAASLNFQQTFKRNTDSQGTTDICPAAGGITNMKQEPLQGHKSYFAISTSGK